MATATAHGYRLELHDVRWTEDVGVSGIIETGGRDGPVRAALGVSGAVPGLLHLDWREGVRDARVVVHGILGGCLVAAVAPAP